MTTRRDRAVGDEEEPDEALLQRLPTAHAVALRLERAGADPVEIGAALGVTVEAVTPLIEIAHRKLAALREPAATDRDRGPAATD